MRRLTCFAMAALVAAPFAPASAATAALVMTCQVRYASTAHMSGDCSVTGIPASGTLHIEATRSDSFALCPVTATASGTMTGGGGLAGFSVDFNLTRVSAAGVVSVTGSTNGNGAAVFTDPCARALTTETMILTLAGT